MTLRPRNPDDILAAEYVLGVLPHAERLAFARRLAHDPALQQRVAQWEQHFAPLTDEIAPVAPAPGVWKQIETQLFPAAAQPATGWWNSLLLWRSLAGVAVIAALVSGALLNNQPTSKSGDLVAQVAGQSEVKLLALYDPATATLRLNRTAGTAPQGRAFELWLIAGPDAPVSLGVLPADPTQRITVPENLRAKMQNAVLAISDEPPGGSPTGQATGAVIATGVLTSI